MAQSDTSTSNTSFEKQRDQLVQEITAAMDSVVGNLEILNRSLQDSIQVGKGFQDASRLWATFYSSGPTDARLSNQQDTRRPVDSNPETAAESEATKPSEEVEPSDTPVTSQMGTDKEESQIKDTENRDRGDLAASVGIPKTNTSPPHAGEGEAGTPKLF